MILPPKKYRERVLKVLKEQNFVIGDAEKKIIQDRTSNERRYFFMVGFHIENGEKIERFIKIPKDNSKKLLLPFQRQIDIAKYLKSKGIIRTRGVISSNYDPKKGIPFAIMETFSKNKSKIGFIEENKGVEFLGKKQADHIIDQLMKFHSISTESLPPSLRKILKANSGNYTSFRRQIFSNLNKTVSPLDGKVGEKFYKVIERHTGISGIKNKTSHLLTKLQPIIDTQENNVLSIAHGDMSPNNLYIFDSGYIEFLDLEWVGSFKNSALAMINDFGNLRERSWKNKKFRHDLDLALIKHYRLKKHENLGKTIVKLSILRSVISLSGAFENYEHLKQEDSIQVKRRTETEKDILEIFNKD